MNKIAKYAVLGSMVGSMLLPVAAFAAVQIQNPLINGKLDDTVDQGSTVEYSFQLNITSSSDVECVRIDYPNSGNPTYTRNITDVISSGIHTVTVEVPAPFQVGQDFDPRIRVYGVDGFGTDQNCNGAVRDTETLTDRLNVEEDSVTPPTGGGDDCNITVMQQGRGASGSDTVELQSYLIGKGHSIPAGPTGFFGMQTYAAVRSYQSANGIPSTGFVGPLTSAHINARICDVL